MKNSHGGSTPPVSTRDDEPLPLQQHDRQAHPHRHSRAAVLFIYNGEQQPQLHKKEVDARMGNSDDSGSFISPLGPNDPKPGDPCRRTSHRGMGVVNAHIIPKSRGGNGDRNNIHKGRCAGCERDYHALFGVMTPEEVIEHLVVAFWNGNDEYVRNYLRSRTKA